MTNTSKTIVFFGNERLVSGLKKTDAPVLRGLIQEGYKIAAVVSHHSDSKSRTNRPLEVAEIAKEHAIPLFLPNKPSEIKEELRALHADAGVLVAYGRIIPQSVIDIFPYGIINIHPSLLPKYRGPTPIEATILNGDKEAGVSIMQLSAGMDEGPIYAQQSLPLTGGETKFDLYEKLSQISAELLLKILPEILTEELLPNPQDEKNATYCKLLTKQDSQLDLVHLTAVQAERTVRAYLEYPKSKVSLGPHTVIITKAHVSPTKKTPLDLECQDGAFLSIDELIAPNGRRMQREDFIRGYLRG